MTDYEALGWELKKKGDYKGAIQAFDKAISHHQKRYFALHGKGECLLKLKKYDESLKCFESAIKRNPKHPWAYHGAGRVYTHLKHYDTAIAYYDKSIRKGPSGLLAYHWKGRTLIEMGEYKKAQSALRTALKNAAGRNRYRIPLIEDDLKKAQAEIKKKHPSKGKPQIIIQNNAAPIAIGGIIAKDDAIVFKPEINNAKTRNSTDNSKAKHDTKTESHTVNKKNIDIHEAKQHKQKIREVKQGFISKVLGRKKHICPNCRDEVEEGDIYCNHCGGKLE